MKYRDPNTGELKDIYVKTADTLPIGTIVDFEGDTVPDGYEEVEEELKSININGEVTWSYDTSVKFFTLPYSEGIHSYIITGVVSYASSDLYSNVMLLVTQTGTNVKIDVLAGSSNNVYSNTGVDLYVKNGEAQANLKLYGVCYILR